MDVKVQLMLHFKEKSREYKLSKKGGRERERDERERERESSQFNLHTISMLSFTQCEKESPHPFLTEISLATHFSTHLIQLYSS